MIEKLHMKHCSLHFDRKHIEESEYQVVVFKHERTEVKLDPLHLKDGKVKTIAELQKFLMNTTTNLIKMMIADATILLLGKRME